MNVRKAAIIAILAIATATGCSAGATPDVDVITKAQSEGLNSLKNPGVTALNDAGYTAVAMGTTGDNQPVVVLRSCGDDKSITRCVEKVRPGAEMPDVYLHIKEVTPDKLVLTGTFDLLYKSPVGHHPDNGMRCNADPSDTPFTAETVKSFKTLGQEARRLNYKGGNPVQTLQLDDNWWDCRSTFGLYL